MIEIIHTHIYDPSSPSLFKSSASDKSECHIYSCEHKDDCEMFTVGKCANVGNPFGARCPYGRRQTITGFTRRARGFRGQINGWKEKHKDTFKALQTAPRRVFKIHGGYFMPYSHIAMNEAVPFATKEAIFGSGCPFLADADVTTETLMSIATFNPKSMMGDIISSYQKEVVPKFIMDLNIYHPDLYKLLKSGFPKADEIIERFDYVGRKALLHTIKPNSEVVISKTAWLWDGNTLSVADKKFMICEPCKWESCSATFTPSKGAEVKITDNNQVCEATEFCD